MVLVSPRSAEENRLGEQGLTPQGDEALRIQIAGMKGPQAHACSVGLEFTKPRGAAVSNDRRSAAGASPPARSAVAGE